MKTNRPQKLTINIRYPSWATAGASVKINGKKFRVKRNPGSYIALERTWKNGDKIEIDFPMVLKVNPSENPDIVSISYGPIVLAAKMGTEGIQQPVPFSNPKLHNDYYTYDYHVPSTLSNMLNVKGKPVEEWLNPVAGQPLTFKTINVADKDFIFVPLFNLHRERYVVYWNLK